MNILYINKFFHIVGGVDRYFFDLADLVKKKGHKVAFFSMTSRGDKKNYWDKYFVSNVSFDKQDISDRLKFMGRTLYSFEAKDKFIRLLKEFKPNLVHIHDIYHHISPSILPEIKKRNIPIVQNVGDYHLVAPNYNLFHRGYICEITKPNKFYKAIFHKCVKSSYITSFVEVVEKYVHYTLGWERNYIDLFLAPSLFMKNKLIEYGLPAEKIIHLPHFVDIETYKPNYERGNYILYFGRLSEEKGLDFLLDVMESLPKIKLKIVGRGSQESYLRDKIRKLKIDNVDIMGFLQGQKLKQVIAGCRFTVLPSLWYEVFGLTILESFASGKPVVASNIGGIPELVNNGFNGLLFKSGHIEYCRKKISLLWDDYNLCTRLGRNGRQTVEKNFNSINHYERLMTLYDRVRQDHRLVST